jgi:RNA polymerase-binding transcription factor DksA
MAKPNKSAASSKRKLAKPTPKALVKPKAPAKPAGKVNTSKPAPVKTTGSGPQPAKAGKAAASLKPVKPAKPAPRPAMKTEPKPVKPVKTTPAPAAPAAVSSASSPLASPAARKGITIVNNRPMKKPKPKPDTLREVSKAGGQLLSPGGPTRKPLIPSGPNAIRQVPLGSQAPSQLPSANADTRSPLPKKEVDRFRAMLIRKRSELVGDVSTMEAEALQSFSGGLSHVPQHIAEQGSDAYDQSLALDLAAADRKLIKEIDDALARIEKGTFGLCELTHKPISAQRLEELPWARYSIEAARELERRGMRV